MSDPRFARLKSDPRFRKLRKKDAKVVIDERFKSIFEDTSKVKDVKGKGKARVDKYGRKISSSHEQKDLRRFYRLEEEDGGSSSINGATKASLDLARGEGLIESSEEEDVDEKESDDESDAGGFIALEPPSTHSKRKLKSKPAVEDEVDLDETQFAALDAQAAEAIEREKLEKKQDGKHQATVEGNETTRLAVVNLDWDHVKASHLFKVLSSVAELCDADPSAKKRKDKTPIGRGKVLSVRVYPSEFGKARIAKEEKEGPPKEIFTKKTSAGAVLKSGGHIDDEDEDDMDEESVNEKTIFQQGDVDQYDQDALRKYQLERLSYYYAIATFDSPKTAAYVYTELEGTELERSANVFDLSYVPDAMTFDDEFRDEATQDLGNYAPVDFVTDALRHSKVKLTWDDDDPTRTAVTRRALSKKEVEENDFRAFIASASDASSGDEGKSSKLKSKSERDRLRALLLGGGDDDDEVGNDLPEGWGGTSNSKSGEMEITFTPGLSSKKGREDGENEENTLQRYMKKQKEKREKRKAERLEKMKEKENGGQKSAVDGDDFFDAGSEDEAEDFGGAEGNKNKKPGKTGAVERVKSPPPAITTIVTNQSPTTGGHGPKHFDMKAVIKAEKEQTRKGKKKGKKSKRGTEDQQEEVEDGRGFEINVGDSRFSALHEEAEFAIDPSHPHFKPTKSMKELLGERSRRLKEKLRDEETTLNKSKGADAGREERDLNKLVESVKRKSSVGGKLGHGEGKRRKLQ